MYFYVKGLTGIAESVSGINMDQTSIKQMQRDLLNVDSTKGLILKERVHIHEPSLYVFQYYKLWALAKFVI